MSETETIKEQKIEQCWNCLKHTMLTLIVDDESDVFKQSCCSSCGLNTMQRQQWLPFDKDFLSKHEIDILHKKYSHLKTEVQAR